MRYTTLTLAAVLSLCTTNLLASSHDDHDHEGEEHGHSDVEFHYHDGEIDIEFGPEGPIFEAEFETSGPSEQITINPGFDSGIGGVNVGDTIDYLVLGPLVYHNGTSFAPVPAGAAIDINDNAGGVLTVDASTVGPVSGTGVIGSDLGGIGEVHEHVEFTLTPSTLGATEYGAYGILMQLTSSDASIEDSAPFYIVFNFGMDEVTFEESVEAFAGTVPEPTAAMLLAVGASFFAAARRR